MRRGEIWTASGGSDYAGKPRPVVILQDDVFDATGSITVCGFTSDPTDAPLFRIAVLPSQMNGLRAASRLMADKVTTVARTKLGTKMGTLDPADMAKLSFPVIVFLNLIETRQGKALPLHQDFTL